MNKALGALALALTVAVPALAQPKADDHAAHHPAGTADRATAMTEGEVRKIDKSAGKLTLKHGEIKNLEMPAMTMVFQVSNASLLDKVRTGDRVRFRAEKGAAGYVVTAIEALR